VTIFVSFGRVDSLRAILPDYLFSDYRLPDFGEG